ncbi:O-antigen ligase [Cupriavidus sp. OV038]|jgi:O-antigen ligase|uniref:O-antigen ligase family protein n=1 Tax=unclassified Cupriavidus TaxID=2640874 RepID=UPI0008EC9FFF|nr:MULTISPECIES: O-antigen ligase family protein [unclassified Cupriavidus]SFB78340.1 O-antigen ligase [Cupriavidus sp. OV038]SFO65501.1 O-antigen ligase [Cupriavidus sp. OV096]
MSFPKHWVSSLADLLVFVFPVLILCVPRGAGVFLAGVGVLALLGWAEMGRAWRQHVTILRPLAMSVLAFIGVYVVSKFLHHTPWDVIDNPSRTLLSVLACWVIFRAAPNPALLWRGITIGLFLALLIVTYQKIQLDLDRPSAWTQAIAFANMVAALALVGFARPGDSRRVHAEAWFNVLCALPILVMNGTRGAMIGMLVTLFPLLLVRYRRFSARMFMFALGGIAALLIGLYQIPGSPVAKRVDLAVKEVQQFQQGNVESSVGARLMMWKVGMQYFVEHPWTGAGVGQFARVLRADPYCEQRRESAACGLEHAHNDLVEAAATTGIPGVLATLTLFLVPAGLFWRALRTCHADNNYAGVSLGGAGLAVVMASLISGLTQVTTAHQANVVFYAGAIGMLLGLAGREAWATRLSNAATPSGQPKAASSPGESHAVRIVA